MTEDPPSVAWMVPYYPWRGDRISGLFFDNQVRALRSHGVPITILAPTPWVPRMLAGTSERWRRYRAAPERQVMGDMHVERPRYATLPRDLNLGAPDRMMARAAWRGRNRWMPVQVIHGHFALTGMAAARLASRMKLPYVLTVHGSDVNTWPARHPEWRAQLVLALRGASQVVAVSQALRDRVHELADVDSLSLPIGIDHASFRSTVAHQHDLRQQAGIQRDAIVALFVGNLLREKGIREFVAGVEAAGPEVVGVAIGDGPERSAISDGAGARLHLLGRQPNAVVASWMSAADVLVLPSHAEGLPTVIVEAGSLAKPVIASAVGGIPELLGDRRGALLPEITGEAVAHALQQVVSDLVGARAMGLALQRQVEEHYDAHRNAARLAGVYRDVAYR